MILVLRLIKIGSFYGLIIVNIDFTRADGAIYW